MSGRPSTRLVQVLLTYCRGMNGSQIGELRGEIRRGRYAWLTRELATAAFAPEDWLRISGQSRRPGETAERAAAREQAQLRRLLGGPDRR